MSDSQDVGFGFTVSTGADDSVFGVNQLPDVFGIVKSKLQLAANDSSFIAQVLGNKANTSEVQSIIGEWKVGVFGQLPSVQVISAADMNGADGAYGSSTQKIYLSNSLFQSGAASVNSVLGAAGVLTEETFHWLDDRVGTDTQGDEGELAKDLLFGVSLSDSELSRIKNEDDRGFINVGGQSQSVIVEQASISGDNSNNTLNGTNSDDVIYGYNGNDYVYANGGNDLVYGGGNDDRLWGGTGNDKIWGEDGADELRGDDGNDELRGGNQDDKLWGGNQDDKLWGEEGNDQLVGDAGNDELTGGNGDDKIWGSAGNDLLWGERGNDQLTGDDGSDILNGYGFTDNERDTLIGGTGADRFVLGDANSVFYTKNGNSDYAVIADFNRGEGDVIALKKLAFNNSSGDRAYGYRLVTVGVNTEIRVDNTNELVATLQNRTGVSLLQGFSFEGTPALRTGQANTDVDGDGKDDAIVVNDNGVTVKLSTGSSFSAHETWIGSAYYGSKGTYFADVDGDGKADAIVVNDNGVTVKRSTGSSFSAHETWIGSAYYGSKGTYFADVDGDGKADAVVVNDNGVTVKRSTGSSFSAHETWISSAYYGSKGTFISSANLPPVLPAIMSYNDFINTYQTKSWYTSANPYSSSYTDDSGVYHPGNCTWYAYGRMLQLGYSKSALDAIRGDASKWGYNAAKAGFQVSGTPTVGSIAVWDGDYSYGGKNKGSSGHVAIVERVYDDGSIDISEANWSLSRYDTRLHISKYEPSKFIVIPKG